MFGDIITDLAAVTQGGMGVAPSGNLNPGGVSMFEPVHGRAIYYAVVRLASAQPPLYLATMTTSFDPSIACIRRSDLAVWGQIRPGMPVFNHHAVVGGDLRVAAPGQEPDDLTLVTSRGPVTIYLTEFDKGCLKEIRHTVQIFKQ